MGHLPGQKTRGQNWAGQVARENGGPPSVKVARVYVVLRYLMKIENFDMLKKVDPNCIVSSKCYKCYQGLSEKRISRDDTSFLNKKADIFRYVLCKRLILQYSDFSQKGIFYNLKCSHLVGGAKLLFSVDTEVKCHDWRVE